MLQSTKELDVSTFDTLPMPRIDLDKVRLSADERAAAMSIVDADNRLLEIQPAIEYLPDGAATLESSSAAYLWRSVATSLSPREEHLRMLFGPRGSVEIPIDDAARREEVQEQLDDLSSLLCTIVPASERYGEQRLAAAPFFRKLRERARRSAERIESAPAGAAPAAVDDDRPTPMMPAIDIAALGDLTDEERAILAAITDADGRLRDERPPIEFGADGSPTLASGAAAYTWAFVAACISPRAEHFHAVFAFDEYIADPIELPILHPVELERFRTTLDALCWRLLAVVPIEECNVLRRFGVSLLLRMLQRQAKYLVKSPE